MLPRLTFVVVALGLLLPAAPVHAGPAAEDAASGMVKFRRVAVHDAGMNNIEALSFLAPVDWKTDGGIQWFPDYFVQANLLMTISDPNTGATVQTLPLQYFTHLHQPVIPLEPGSNYLGMIVARPTEDIPQFIQWFYAGGPLRHLRGIEPRETEELQKVADEVAKAQGGGTRARAARVRYAYERGGQPWEEDVYVTLVYTPWQMGVAWAVPSAYAFRAPRGQLDKLTPTMQTIVRTGRVNLDWFAGYMYVQKLFQERMAQGIRNAGAISEMIARNSEEIRQMYSDAWKEACASQDRVSQSYSEYIRGVETYHNPFEDRPIQLPSGYTDAWVNPQGEYVLSTDTGFNPNVGDTREWRRMEVAK